MIYFTADLHIGHTNIIKHCSRPFVSVEEMNETLLCNWNEKVNIGDTVYILGDFFFRNVKSAGEYLQQMNGKKRLIIGNHDKEWMKKVDLLQYFEEVEQMKIFSDGSHKITLCHYPLVTWEGVAKGTYMIHGHIHNNTDSAYWNLLADMPGALNAGVDVNHFVPVGFSELVKNNEEFKAQYKSQQVIAELGKSLKGLTDVAVRQYTPMVEDILSERINSRSEIERILDGMLDFGGAEEMEHLFKKVCQVLYPKYPQMIEDYVMIYRDMFLTEELEDDSP